jgi:S-methylmethionine-dependent homocysteine/selenocysteine methylase
VFALARDVDAVVAVGVNCTAPVHVEALVRAAVSASGKPAVAYPNSGEWWDAESRTWGGGGAGVDGAGVDGAGVDGDAAVRWVAAGARWVGGCCRVGADDIRRLAASLRR